MNSGSCDMRYTATKLLAIDKTTTPVSNMKQVCQDLFIIECRPCASPCCSPLPLKESRLWAPLLSLRLSADLHSRLVLNCLSFKERKSMGQVIGQEGKGEW